MMELTNMNFQPPRNLRTRDDERFLFFEMGYAFGEAARSIFVSLAKTSDSSKFGFCVVEPDPKEFYLKHFNQLPSFEFTATSDADAYYVEQMTEWPPGNTACAPIYSEIALWHGRNWWAWAEREFNTCAICLPNENLERTATEAAESVDLPLLSIDEVIRDILFLEHLEATEFVRFGRKLPRTLKSIGVLI